MNPTQVMSAHPPIDDLERRQDEVLVKLEELDAAILCLLEEFNARLAGDSSARGAQAPTAAG